MQPLKPHSFAPMSVSVDPLVSNRDLLAITERIAAIADLGGSPRVLLGGCNPGDGVSTTAEAIANGLSSRHDLVTLLVDAGLDGKPRPPYSRYEGRVSFSGRFVRVRATERPKLAIAQCHPLSEKPFSVGLSGTADGNSPHIQMREMLDELDKVITRYSATVIDLGVIRFDARMLGAARPDDPILIVARFGRTRRDDLEATSDVLRLSKKTIGGVILNDYESPATDYLESLLGVNDKRK